MASCINGWPTGDSIWRLFAGFPWSRILGATPGAPAKLATAASKPFLLVSSRSSSLMADYSTTSATLTAFNQQLPPGWKQFLPLPFTPPNDIQPDSRNRLPLVKDAAPGLAPAL